MSKEGAKRLLSLLEDFISSKPPSHFARIVRDGETVFILQLGFMHMATSLYFQNSYVAVGKASLLFQKEIWVVVGEDLVLT